MDPETQTRLAVFFSAQSNVTDLLNVLKDFLEMRSVLSPSEIIGLLEALDLKSSEVHSVQSLAAVSLGDTALICDGTGVKECRVYDIQKGRFASYLPQNDAAI